MKICIEIDRLVLHGFDYHNHKRISAAIEQELSHLIKDNGLGQQVALNREILVIDAGSFNLELDMVPKTVGEEIARLVYRGLEQRWNL